MMDGLIRLGEQKGLGARSAGFIAATLRYMLSHEHGGLRGFLDRFGRVGHGEAVASWIAKDSEKAALTEADLDEGLPANVAHQLAGLFWLPRHAVRDALRWLIPRLVDRLTPDGLVPDLIAPEIQRFVDKAARSEPLETATASFLHRPTAPVRPTDKYPRKPEGAASGMRADDLHARVPGDSL